MNTETATRDRAEINRANAQHSTGPKTAAGKQRSSLNALRHGLSGHTVILPSDDLVAYKIHTRQFADEYQPKGVAEVHLVQMLSDTAWRIHRIPALEANMFSLAVIERADSINTADPAIQAALAMAQAFNENPRAFANLGAHDQRLSRRFEKTLAKLEELQERRKKKEALAMEEAAKLLELHNQEKTSFAPAELGFEFSIVQIEKYMYRRDRLAKAETHQQGLRHQRFMAA